VSEFISYATGRCCCGKFNDLDKGEEFIHNDIVHQLLGPEDNFCGHRNTHLIIKLESRVRELEAENNSISELFDAAGQDNNILHERIKVLEDALNFYQYVENYKSTTPIARGDGSYDYDVPVLIDNGEIARATLEVK